MNVQPPHKCPAPGCDKKVPNSQFACRGHWYSIPSEIRSRIWAGYRSQDTIRHNQAMLDGKAFLEAKAAAEA